MITKRRGHPNDQDQVGSLHSFCAQHDGGGLKMTNTTFAKWRVERRCTQGDYCGAKRNSRAGILWHIAREFTLS